MKVKNPKGGGTTLFWEQEFTHYCSWQKEQQYEGNEQTKNDFQLDA